MKYLTQAVAKIPLDCLTVFQQHCLGYLVLYVCEQHMKRHCIRNLI